MKSRSTFYLDITATKHSPTSIYSFGIYTGITTVNRWNSSGLLH